MLRKLAVLLIAASCAMTLHAQTSSPVDDIGSAANQILSDVTAVNSLVAGLNATISQDTATIQQQQSTIDSDGAIIASDSSHIQQLQSELSAATAAQALSSSFLQQFSNLQSLSGWVLAGGSAGNSGQTGSLGTGTLTPNSDGTATLAITPYGAYYDAFFYRKNGVVPHPVAGYIGYRADWNLDAANLPLSQAIEMDGSDYDGHWRYQPAMQLEMGSHLLRYYNPKYACGSTSGWCAGWFSTGISYTPTAGQWFTLEMLTKIDSVNGRLTYVGAVINGTVYPLNITVGCKSTTNVWIESSLQLDSNSAGKAYQAQVRNVGMYWF